MRKLILLCMMLLVGANVVKAEINCQVDKFTNEKEYYSDYKYQKGASIIFSKFVAVEPHYELQFYNNSSRYDRHKSGFLDMKIDDVPVKKIEIIEIDGMKHIGGGNGSLMWCTIALSVGEMMEMVNAERVAFKVYYENSPADVVVIPKEILAEWKEVSRKEK